MSEVSAWYAVVDGAADERLYDLISITECHGCLYLGEYDPSVRIALPYLVKMHRDEKFSQIWSSHESGNFWGLLCQSKMSFVQLLRQLRHFTTAKLPLGDIVLFRFWDPRVFVPFVENGTEKEVAPFFKSVDTYIVDQGRKGRRSYRWNNGLEKASL